jgi:hypothetical protein
MLSKDKRYTTKQPADPNAPYGVGPNGLPYSKNDVDYLLKQGYTQEQAIEMLSKDKRYTTPLTEEQKAELNKKKHQDRFNELRAEIKQCKTKIKELFGDEFFTDKSPLWLSQKTGGCMFLSDWQGGVIEVKLEKID